MSTLRSRVYIWYEVVNGLLTLAKPIESESYDHDGEKMWFDGFPDETSAENYLRFVLGGVLGYIGERDFVLLPTFKIM